MAASASSSCDISEGPVLNLLNKRIRALKKKMNRIIQMEEAISQGKPINREQQQVLLSKPSVAASIDELEKLRQPLSSALKDEIALAFHQTPLEETPKGEDFGHSVVEDLLNVLYFGSLFDVKSQNEFTSTMLTRTHERGCCLTYDYVTDDDANDLLGEKDLDLISRLGGLLISRPVDSSLSHKNALQRCIEHAKLWIHKADMPIDSNVDVTYAGLRERLNKIMSSEYFTTTPEMKAPVEVAAAAAGNFASFQVPVVQGNSVPVEVEGSVSPSQEKDEGAANFEGHESGDNQSGPEEEFHKDQVEVEYVAEMVSVQQEEVKPHVDAEQEYAQRDPEAKEQQHHPRRGGYQSQRGGRGGGGGRRGYSNGRGGRGAGRGGGYYNGRNQYYDQSGGNYYPRNYHNNRGRGGRGGSSGGGGHFYDNHGSGGQANHVVDLGVQS